MSEQEKRKHRCCFSGHRPEKLLNDETTVRSRLKAMIDRAIGDGYTVFITGMAMGVDLWAAQIVLQKRQTDPRLRLIAATPYPTFSYKWREEWKKLYSEVWNAADYRVTVSSAFEMSAFQKRNEWMVDHSARLLAYYNGADGGTKNTIEYAQKQGIEVVIEGIQPETEPSGN